MPELVARHPSSAFLGRCGSGFVLAGGRSSRMGTDKAHELFSGIPLIQNALNILRLVSASVEIAGSRTTLAAFAHEIPDTFADSGPLGGIHAALSVSKTEWNIFLPVDMPLMPPTLLACLLDRAKLTGSPVTAAKLNGELEPFPVVLHRSVLPQITGRLLTGEAACHAAWRAIPPALGSELDAVSAEILHQAAHCFHPAGLPPRFWFQNANTPTDLARLNRYAAGLRPAAGPASQVI